MGQFTASADIDSPVERVWEVVAEFGDVYLYNPSVTASHLTSDVTAGVGTSRHCDLTLPGASVEERIVEWEDGRGYTLEISDSKRVPFRRVRARLRLRSSGDHSTRVEMGVDYDVRYGAVGGLLDRTAIRRQNEKAIARTLAGLKRHVENAEVIGAGVRVDHSIVTVS